MPRKRDLTAELERVNAENDQLRARVYDKALAAIRADNTPTPAQAILERSVLVIQGLTAEIEDLVDAYLRFYRFVQIEFESEPYEHGPTSYLPATPNLDRAAQRIARAWQCEHIRMMLAGWPEIDDDAAVCGRTTDEEAGE